jgi:hypothetical protein
MDVVDVRTLRQAQEQLVREWPGRHASNSAWLAYHQHGAELFAAAAEADQEHHYEALYFAQQEREEARRIAAQIGVPSNTA